MAKKKSFLGFSQSLNLGSVPWFLVVLIALVLIVFAQNGKDTIAQLFGQQFCYAYENGSCLSRGLKVSCAAEGLLTGPQCLDPERTFGAAPSAVTVSRPIYTCDNATAPVCAGTCPSGTTCRPFGETGSCACYGTVTPPASLKCCTCYFEPHPECDGRDQTSCTLYECTDGIDNDGDGKIDDLDAQCAGEVGLRDESETEPGRQGNNCSWSGGQADGVCKSRFEIQCGMDFAGNSCDYVRVLPEGPSVPYPAYLVCTESQDFHEGHSDPSECTSYIEEFRRCIQCNSAQCQIYTINGCSTFENLEAARAAAITLQGTMAANGIETVIVEGNQMESSPTCKSTVTFTITETGVTETYGPCNVYDYCYTNGATFKCTNTDGIVVDGICCSYGNYPNPVRRIAVDGVCPESHVVGECRAERSAFFCSNARSQVQTVIQACLAQASAACFAHPLTQIFSSQNPSFEETSSTLSCTVSGVSTWTCRHLPQQY